MKISTAKEIVGGLSSPSKMPCHGYSLPAKECITGSKLRKVKGSTCASCYALKGRYVFKNVQDALYRRLESLKNRAQWIEAMAFLINHYETDKSGISMGVFRWHDSGDLQSVDHLAMIVEVCNATPTVQHWLPSREYGIVRKYLATVGPLPINLTIRLSAHMVGQYKLPEIPGVVWSTVGAPEGSYECPAVKHKTGKCGTCRACWDKSVLVVDYGLH